MEGAAPASFNRIKGERVPVGSACLAGLRKAVPAQVPPYVGLIKTQEPCLSLHFP